MHLYILVRGVKHFQDLFISQLQGKFLPFKYFNEKGKRDDSMCPVGVRPIQLYEVVFNKSYKGKLTEGKMLDCESMMYNTILGPDNSRITQHKKHNKFIWGLRKMLGIKAVPDYEPGAGFPINREHLEIVGVGTKDDKFDKNGVELL